MTRMKIVTILNLTRMTIPNLMRMKIELFVALSIQMKVDFGLVAMAAMTSSTLKVQTSRVKKACSR